MKKILILSAITFFSFYSATAQNGAKAAYVELGGAGFASVNYDMRVQKKETGLGFRAGVGALSIHSDFSSGSYSSSDRITVVTFPLEVNYLLGREQRYLELGAGATIVTVKDKFSSTDTDSEAQKFSSSLGHLYIGYRRQPEKSGFLFRAGITPLFNKNGFFPLWAGVSFGYKF